MTDTTTQRPRRRRPSRGSGPWGSAASPSGAASPRLAAVPAQGGPAVARPAPRAGARLPQRGVPGPRGLESPRVTAVAAPAGRVVPRVPFVLLVLALLGGSLICLLVINTTLGAASFRISQLQKTSARLSTQEQDLRQQVAAEKAPAAIAERAYALGMRAQSGTTILDLRSGQINRLPGQAGMGVQLGAPPASTAAQPKKPAAGQQPAAAASPSPSAGTPAPARSSP